MRKLILSVILPLLLLCAQQGALRHEIGHLSEPAAPVGQRDHDQPGDKLCESCLAFAQLGVGAMPSLPPLLLPAFSHARPAGVAVAFLAAQTPAARSRGPPLVL